jgi:hypothetical protein
MEGGYFASPGLYCLLITHPTIVLPGGGGGGPAGGGGAKEFHVSLVPHPLIATVFHNQQRSRARDLRDAAPFIVPIRAAGPFYLESTATDFAHEFVHGTRGLNSLCKRMESLSASARYKVNCFSLDVTLKDDESLLDFLLRNNASEEYIEAARRLEEARKVLLESSN